MSLRTGVITCTAVTTLGVAALLAGAATDQRWSAFSLDVPPAGPVAALSSGQQVCQGPFDAAVSFGSVRAWIAPIAAPGASLQLRVRSVSGATLATGRSVRSHGKSVAPTINLNATVPARTQISVCISSGGPARVTLLGAGSEFALLFLRPHPESLLSLLPTVFRRAALFRPTWVGSWTFWLLSAGLISCFCLGVIAVAQAVRSDVSDPSAPGDP